MSVMRQVRQAHLPGNYELYDSSSNKLGPVVCRDCWENAKKETTASLETVWVSVRGEPMIWWLCQNHMALLKGRKSSEIRFVKFVHGAVPDPKL